MNKPVFLPRFLTTGLIGIGLAFSCAVPYWAGALLGLVLAVVFTVISEGVLRGRFWGKIGKGLIAIYSVHLLGETITYAALIGLCGLVTSYHVGYPILFGLFVTLGWLHLCFESLASIFRLCRLWLGTHR
jgi:hypothetical protein